MLSTRKISGLVALLVFKDEGKGGSVEFSKRSIICHLPVPIAQPPHHFLEHETVPGMIGWESWRPSVMLSI